MIAVAALAIATSNAVTAQTASIAPNVRITDANGDQFDIAAPYTADIIATTTSTQPTTTSTQPTTTSTQVETLTLGFAGDIGFNSDAQTAIAHVNNNTNLDAMMIAGDLGYSEATATDWCAAWTKPLYLIAGNHEDDSRTDGWIGDFVDACGTPADVTGEHGIQWHTDLGPVTVIGIAADLTINGYDYQYDTGSPERQWLEQTVNNATSDWIVVLVHKLCRNIDTGKTCSLDPTLVDYLDVNADLIVHGHEHIYQRTNPLPATWLGSGIFGARDSTCTGTTHTDRSNDPDYPDYATSMCQDDIGWGHGYAAVTFTADTMTGEWINWENPTGYTDSWSITR